MARLPQISEAEWEVMNVVWDRHPVSANDVAETLEPRTGWSSRTVKTLLGRLVKKGALAFREEGRRYLYRPRVERTAMVTRESRTFIHRVLGGQASPLIAQIVDDCELSAEEIAALRRLLDEKARR
jgi:BlaI family penicillinase repressor